MNFVIGFLGLFIYMIYACYKSIASDNAERQRLIDYNNYIKNKNKWIEDVVDIELESCVKKFIYDVKNSNYIYVKVSSIISTFPNFNLSYNNSAGFVSYMNSNYYLMIERILMACYGKLLYSDAMYGILSPPVYDNKMLKLWEINNDLMVWINSKIISYHNNYEMKFVECTNIESAKYGRSKINSIGDNIKRLRGKYFWEPILNNI